MLNESNTQSVAGNGADSSVISAASAKAYRSASSMSREFHNFLADVEDLISDTTSLTGEDLARIKTKLSERVADAKESFESMGGDMAQRARKTVAVTNEYVHEQPWKAIGISAAFGFLLGFVLARRN